MLEHLLEHPFYNIAKICRSMGDLSEIIGRNILQKLEEQGYAESLTINSGTGRPKKLYVGTEKGAEFLGEDWKKVKPKGKGSLHHQAGQCLLFESLGGSDHGVHVEYYSADVA